MWERLTIGAFALIVLFVAGCGPATFTRTRMVFEPYSERESRQQKDGVVAELRLTRETPASFLATVQRCDRAGRLLVDPLGQPAMERVSMARPGQMWEQIALTNNTDHVLRMSTVVIRLHDPAGNQIEPMNWGDIQSELMAERPCPSTAFAVQQLRVNKVFDRNMEIVPRSTSTFWLPFRPPSLQMAGTWRFTIYEVPVQVDAAGRPTRTTQFDLRVSAKQIVETLHRDDPMSKPRVIQTKEVTDGAPTAPAVGTPPVVQATAPRQSESPRSQPEPIATPAPVQAAPSPQSAAAPVTPQLTQTKEVVSRAQVRLKELGFDPGGSDGIAGPRTIAAIRKFQAARKLPVSGELDHGTLGALGVQSQ